MQHFMSVGSEGQKPAVEVPPPVAQFAVEMQTPGVLPTVQRPLMAA